MSWKKLGKIFDPRDRYDWMKTHASLPTILRSLHNKNNDVYGVYFAARDSSQRSQVGRFTIDINKPQQIMNISSKPVLEFGEMGYFDEHGVYPASFINVGDDIYMYYIGWNRGAEPPMFYAAIGLAISKDGGRSFKKISKAPLLSRSEHDPWMVTSPYVIKDENIFRMYYVSGVKWKKHDSGSLNSIYHIKYAESTDGIDWDRKGIVSIDHQNESECDISRACVIKEQGIYKAYFSVNTLNKPYRLGYAESVDGIRFKRNDKIVQTPLSKNRFDSEMMAYPYIINHNDVKYMFYNGNSFGRDGIGLAIWGK